MRCLQFVKPGVIKRLAAHFVRTACSENSTRPALRLETAEWQEDRRDMTTGQPVDRQAARANEMQTFLCSWEPDRCTYNPSCLLVHRIFLVILTVKLLFHVTG